MKKNQPQPYKMGDLIVITKRLCSDKVQPNVKVGTNYLVLAEGKIKNGAIVLKVAEFTKMAKEVLVRPKDNIDPRDMIRVNEQRFEWKRLDKRKLQAEFLQFKQEFEKKQEEREKEYLESMFTEQERIQMAYHPYLYAELAWHYAEKAIETAKNMRNDSLKKVSRMIRCFRVDFNCELKKKMTQNVLEAAKEKVQQVLQNKALDFFIFFTTVKNEINRQHVGLELNEIRSYAYMSILCMQSLKRLDSDNTELIRMRLGQASQHESYKYMKELRSCMDAIMDGVKIEKTQPIKTTIAIIEKLIEGTKL